MLSLLRVQGWVVCVPQDPRVLDRMLPYLTAYYGNPHSRTHAYGWESEAAMEKARRVSLWLSAVAFLLVRKFSVEGESSAMMSWCRELSGGCFSSLLLT